MKIGCSPLSGTIFVGNTRIDKKGFETWTKKEDVTDDAVTAVAQCLLVTERKFFFNYRGKKYVLEVKENEDKNG